MNYNVVKTKDGEILLDLREDSVNPSSLLEGFTAHDRSGAIIEGTYVPEPGIVDVTIKEVQ